MSIGIGAGMGSSRVLSYVVGDDGTVVWLVATRVFLLAFPLGLIGLHLRRRVAGVSSSWPSGPRILGFLTIRLVKLGCDDRAAVLRGFYWTTAGSLAFSTFFIAMPNNLIARHGADPSPTLLVTAAAWPPSPSPLWRSESLRSGRSTTSGHRFQRNPGRAGRTGQRR